LGHQRILWEILAELGRIGDEDESAEMRAEARRIVERIASDVEGDLRASFIARPEVRAVFS
jgi:hypothetical protein